MKILENSIIKDSYDVIVVGAGIGGMTTAALLANKGLDVLVIEQHYIPGGCCTAIRRHGIAFDVGAAMLFGFGEEGYNPHRFVMNELEEEIDMIPHDSIFRMNFSGKQVTFWRDFDRYFKELVVAFPHEANGLKALYKDLRQLYFGVIGNKTPAPPTEMHLMDGMKGFFNAPLGTMKLGLYLFKTVRDVCRKYISDPEVIGFFDMLMATMFCCTTAELPALLGSIIMIDTHVGGACYPSGSPQMLPNKLENSIEKRGGAVLYRQMVKEIIIEDKTAVGVRLQNGAFIKADKIVSGTTIWNLVGGLIDKQYFSAKQITQAHSMIPTFSVLLLYIGVDKEAVPPEMRPIEMFVQNINDLQADNYFVYIPSLDDPSICPDDAHSLTVLFPTQENLWPKPGSPLYQSEEYNRLKEKEADKVVSMMEDHFPNLRKHIRVMEIGTPTTIERFTQRKNGCVGGPKQMMGQEMLRRPKSRGFFKNLYLCGDSTVMGEGVVATTSSGVGAANMILRDLDIKEYRPRNHSRQWINLVEGKPRSPLPDVSESVSESNAVRLAMECQLCEKPACKDACPASIDVLNFVRRIEAGNFAGAARAVREMNPLAEICGHICPSERFCEKDCNRLEFAKNHTRIRELHGWVAGHVTKYEGWSRRIDKSTGEKIAVIGAGPAGLSCAHFLARLGHNVDIYDKAEKAGGMLAGVIPAFRLPEKTVMREIDGLTLPGMSFHYNSPLGEKVLLPDLQQRYRAVFLAPGLWAGRNLDLPGEAKAKRVDALSFLKDFRSGAKKQVKGKVLVIGGGSVAADVAVTAKEAGASKVVMICLEQAAEMPCLPSEQAELQHQGIEIKNGWGPKAYPSSKKLEFICCTKVFDDQCRFAPQFDNSQKMEEEFDLAVVAVGQTVESDLQKYLAKELGFNGRLTVNEATQEVEGQKGLYAGGDIIRGAGTVVQAVADGRRAAAAIDRSLRRS